VSADKADRRYRNASPSLVRYAIVLRSRTGRHFPVAAFVVCDSPMRQRSAGSTRHLAALKRLPASPYLPFRLLSSVSGGRVTSRPSMGVSPDASPTASRMPASAEAWASNTVASADTRTYRLVRERSRIAQRVGLGGTAAKPWMAERCGKCRVGPGERRHRGEQHRGERHYTGEPHAGERPHRDVWAGPRTKQECVVKR
jgi:hypothetical protein